MLNNMFLIKLISRENSDAKTTGTLCETNTHMLADKNWGVKKFKQVVVFGLFYLFENMEKNIIKM